MAIDFKSDEFKELKNNLIIEFNQYLQEKDFEKYHELLKVFLFILEDKNQALLNLNNTGFNNTISERVDIRNTYSSLQVNLSNIKNKNLNKNDYIDNIISEVFLCLYVNLYQAWIIQEHDRGYYEEYYKYIQELYKHFICLNSDVQKIINEYPYYTLHQIYINYEDNKHQIKVSADFLQNITKNMDMIKTYHKTIEKYTSDVSAIETKLEKQRQEFNFIRLADAFQKMQKDKQTELEAEQKYNSRLMGGIGLLLVVKLLYALFGSFSGFDAKFTFISLSSIFLIAVLIYFFRISLMNIKSIKSQILQLDLRLSLCQFIYNYAEDSEKMRKDNMKNSLDRFESIIFSPIVANEEQIPATFDNLDQFIKMMNVANSGKGETKS